MSVFTAELLIRTLYTKSTFFSQSITRLWFHFSVRYITSNLAFSRGDDRAQYTSPQKLEAMSPSPPPYKYCNPVFLKICFRLCFSLACGGCADSAAVIVCLKNNKGKEKIK